MPKDITFKITYMPFNLIPNNPKSGIDRAEYLKENYGIDPAKLKEHNAKFEERCKKYGMGQWQFPSILPNTINAFRLTELAKV